jgi:DHA3 family macrolide efflux protein-like MFS transporter
MSELASGPVPEPDTGWKVPYFSMWGGQAVSLLGSRVAAFAVIWWMTISSGSAVVLTTATLVGIVPEIILGPFVGVLVDRWNRRLVMILADVGVALVSLLLAYLFWIDAAEIWHIYVILFMRAIIGAFHWPAFLASTSLMVPDDQLTRVAGLNQGVGGLITIIGPPLGALLMGLTSLAGVMMVDVVTAIVAVVPLLLISVPQPQSRNQIDEPLSYWSDLRQGFSYIRGWKGLMGLIGMAIVIKIALTPAFSLMPLLVSDYFNGTVAQFSIVEAATGIGIIAGGAVLALWGGFKKRILTSLIGVVLLGVGLVALGFVPETLFIAAVGITFFLGITIPIIDGPIMAILQGNVSPEMQGRVFTLLTSLVSITSPIGLIIAGPVSEAVGIQAWFIASGILCIVVGASLFFVPAIINIEDNRVDASLEANVADVPESSTVG